MQVNELNLLKKATKEGIKEALKEERFRLYEALVPIADSKEQAEIESRYGTPGNYDEREFEDLTDWVFV
ncbi:MAG: hypothetical protein ACM3SY_07515 [Candidatus Omnitrophota bacterium]